jgi:DNA-binding response OmpR family regulator
VSLPLGTDHLPADRLGASRTPASTATEASPYVEEAIRWLPDENLSRSFAGAAGTLQEVLAPESLGQRPPGTPAAGDAVVQRPRILWADDNADMREYVRRLLRGRYEVEAVPDGEAALAAARALPPELVLADVMMPRMDGFKLLRELRADLRTRAIPVILLSARAGEESRVDGLQAGADDYLIKPFSARELLARVDAHVEMNRLRLEASHREQALLVETRAAEQRLAAELAAMNRLQKVSAHLVHDGRTTPLLDEIVDAAIAITGADMGNIQLLDQGSGAL